MFPDQIYLEQIRSALWQGREYGRAGVFVGAGFSRNAIAAKPSPRPLPLWSDLAVLLIDQLHPTHSASPAEREAALRRGQSTSGALRIAQEFEAAHGRQRLERLLVEHIDDLGWRPGKLHRLLLELPWSDVLTTNYDTLIERAASLVADRKYDLVCVPAEIPSSSRPRIVKLHGSLPSVRPLILTEEDFRTYLQRFGPFVSLVQQSMMEHIVCLIGFSGDDPNFLYWSGWVRDQLGRSAPRVYLCGVLNLNDAQRRLLHERNVTPIDLAPIFPIDVFPDPDTRHGLAAEWFLLNLEAGRPPDPLLWPRRDVPPRTEPAPGVPPLLPTPFDQPRIERRFPKATFPE
jgi:hypothetical protein